MNDGFYSYIKHFHEKHGDMKIGYIRFNDVVYSKVPYIKDIGYFDFMIDHKNKDKISVLQFTEFDKSTRSIMEFMETDEMPDCSFLDNIPSVTSIKFPTADEDERFVMKLDFANGERRKFYLPVSWDDEVITYNSYVFTDKIWSSAKISAIRQKPLTIQYNRYNECGQGIDFLNGFSLSAIRCYLESVPYFDDKTTEIKFKALHKFSVSKYDYENNYAVDYVSEFSCLCLIDKNKQIIKKLPDEYQKTQLYIYPPCGGINDGLIMVNTLGEIDLQYYHNLNGCAGMWGWIDVNLNIVIEPKYIFAYHFYDNKALVCKGEWTINEENLYWCDDEKWGMIDKSENEIVPFIFDELSFIKGTER